MTAPRFNDIRLVLDTNTVLRGLTDDQSPSGTVLQYCDARQLRLLLSKPVVTEYRRVMAYKKVVEQFPEITRDQVELVIRRLRFVAEKYAKVTVHFDFPRDPRDAKFIELAIFGNATHIITHDLDLLSLKAAHSDAGKRLRQRLPHVQILTAADFLKELSVKAILPP